MITISQLEYIVAVDRERHFGRAARDCSVSQPSLSLQIQKVEDIIGFLIFDRSAKRKIVPTEKGQRFISQAKIVLREHQKLLIIVQKEEGEIVGDFSLGIIPTVLPYLVPRFISAVSQRYPRLRLSIQERTTEEIISLLREEKLDAGILATPLEETNIWERPLYYEEFFFYASKTHPLFKKKQLDVEDLDPADIWLLDDGHCLRNQVLHFCHLEQKNNRMGAVSFEGGSLETLRQIILKNGGYTLVPQMFIETLPLREREQILSFREPVPTREIALVFNRHQWKKDILRALQNCIVENLGDGSWEKGRKGQQILRIS